MQNELLNERMEILLNFIMKKCLWQFHSRSWDRERQNKNILEKTTLLLCNEPIINETQEDKCYWVDAVYLSDNYKKRFPWIQEMEIEDIKSMMDMLKNRLDYLTISGSLNKELKDPLY